MLSSSTEVFFDGLPNKETIISGIKETHSVIRDDEQQTTGLKDAMVFSVTMDEIVDINGIMAKYRDSNVREELCCLKPMTDTTKGEDIAKAFF